jgi:hypothetical protein
MSQPRGVVAKIFAVLAGLLMVAFGNGDVGARDTGCAQRVFDPPDTAVLEGLHADASGSEFHIAYVFHGTHTSDYVRFAAVEVDDARVVELSVSPRSDAPQEISLASLKPGPHRIYVEFMNDKRLRGRASMAIESCIVLPRRQEIDHWQLVP